MARLINKTRTSNPIAQHVMTADSFWTRLKGLLGTQNLPEGQTLWIHRCNSVHTFFMSYAIDCIFVDRNLCVIHTKENLVPFRVTPIYWRAQSVFELPAGTLKKHPVKKGDQLHVGT